MKEKGETRSLLVLWGTRKENERVAILEFQKRSVYISTESRSPLIELEAKFRYTKRLISNEAKRYCNNKIQRFHPSYKFNPLPSP